MIEDTHRELIEREIDGENGPEESAELRRLLAERPEIAGVYERMKAIADALDPRAMVDPPAELKERILAVVRPIEMRSVAVEPQRSFAGWLASLFAPPRLRYAAVLAAGIAVGFAGAGAMLDGRSDSRAENSGAAGTMVTAPASGMAVVDRAAYDVDGATGTIAVAADRAEVEVRLENRGDSPVTLELTADPALFDFDALRRQAGASAVHIDAAADRIVVTRDGGGAIAILGHRADGTAGSIAWRITSGEGAASGTLDLP